MGESRFWYTKNKEKPKGIQTLTMVIYSLNKVKQYQTKTNKQKMQNKVQGYGVKQEIMYGSLENRMGSKGW